MGIGDFISLLGAVALFLFGMTTMSDGLEKLSGGRLESILEKLSNNPLKGVLLGALVTGLIQSSSATTVMCVGFVNAGIMKLPQTVGIIMGANIGTTVTAQLLRLGDISADATFMRYLSPEILGPVFAVIGVILFMFIRSGRKKDVGQIILGFGILFIGMDLMKDAVVPLHEDEGFHKMLVAFSNPVLGILAGAVVTAILQSSSASVGILQTISSAGGVTFSAAAPLIMGQNIGTCVTALISSAGADTNAKRTAMLHLLFNIIGTIVFIIVLYAANSIFTLPFWEDTMNAGSIATIHLVFNLGCTALLLPFANQLVALVTKMIPDKNGKREEASELDPRFLSSPSLALEHATSTVIKMGNMALENYDAAMQLFNNYDLKKHERINDREESIDHLEGEVDNYLIKLTDKAVTREESVKISELLRTLSDFERMGDYVINLAESAASMKKCSVCFTPEAKVEFTAMGKAVREAMVTAIQAFAEESESLAFLVEPIEEVVDIMHDELKDRHIERIKTGKCKVDQGTMFIESLVNLERISDHASNVAMYILKKKSTQGDIIREDSHEYFHKLHHGGNQEYDLLFEEYKNKYMTMMEK